MVASISDVRSAFFGKPSISFGFDSSRACRNGGNVSGAPSSPATVTLTVSGAIAGVCLFCGGVFPRLRLACARENLLLHLLQQIVLPFHFAVFDLEQDERAKSPFAVNRPDQIRIIG